MAREFELKFRAEEEAFAALRRAFPTLSPISMETTYYDTPDGALNRRCWMLRRRMENGVAVCTLKTPLSDGSRGEWEIPCGDIRQAIPELCKLKGDQELERMVSGGLEETCGARFTRLVATLEIPGAVVELALDEGILFGGGGSCPLREVEVELKEGAEEGVLAFGAMLAHTWGLEPERRSKHKRALALTKKKEA